MQKNVLEQLGLTKSIEVSDISQKQVVNSYIKGMKDLLERTSQTFVVTLEYIDDKTSNPIKIKLTTMSDGDPVIEFIEGDLSQIIDR